ncbi:restriction endonuclease subunit S [Methyloprofundus sedimenti]|uniref:restriction endonuclease subunit S n=1 Tax=Methyloprofundus sedimenti TaxID=1420851 RepID=UPI0009B5EE9D|nr:restriction endonuclease subunit S [Methyloprofundus sedimenti]
MTVLAVMPKYKVYKDSGVEWLGHIPSHWLIRPFTKIFSFGRGLSITKENLQNEGIPCVNYGEIHSKYVFEVDPNKHLLKCVDNKYLDSSYKSLLKYGDFVFADTSEDIEGSGNFTYLNSKQNVFAGYHTVIARPIEAINKRFLAYILDSISYRTQIRRKVKGVKVYSITQAILKSTKLWLPPDDEQTTIANFLDKKTAQIDQAIAIKQKQIELLKERKQIIIQKAVTQGLDPDVPLRDSGVDWIGEIPEHWEIRRSKFLFTQRKERAWKDDVQLSATQAYGVIPQDEYEEKVGRKVVKIQFHLDKRKHVELNDFVISMRSFQGGLERAWARGCIRSSYIILRSLEDIDTNFYSYLLKLPSYIKALQKTASFIRDGQDLNFENFSKVDLFIPPLKEQNEIAMFIVQQTSLTDIATELYQQQIKNLKEYKTTLINSAVTGKIKVPELV